MLGNIMGAHDPDHVRLYVGHRRKFEFFGHAELTTFKLVVESLVHLVCNLIMTGVPLKEHTF